MNDINDKDANTNQMYLMYHDGGQTARASASI